MTPPVKHDPLLPDCILCDIDGTLAFLGGGRDPYDSSRAMEDTINMPVAEILEVFKFHRPDVLIIFVTGRHKADYEVTAKWLYEVAGFSGNAIYMRATGDKRKDSIVKQELYEKHIKGELNVLFVLDDRQQVVDMWRAIGLTCLQVAPGDF